MLTNIMAKLVFNVQVDTMRSSFLYVGNNKSLVVYIIFNTYVMMSYVVFKSQNRRFPAPVVLQTITHIYT